MTNFTTILQLDGGLASYYVEENRGFYSAALIKSTASCTLPEEVVISRKQTLKASPANDPVMNKLINAIKSTEANPE
ncbi:MAG: hypothetical protein ICV66_12530 [Chitinophagaceae bacterium]|nr:hypothetical protein [Chitinophagaceae bacterium]